MIGPSPLRIGVDVGSTKIEAIALDGRGHGGEVVRTSTMSGEPRKSPTLRAGLLV